MKPTAIPLDKLMASVLTPAEQEIVHAGAKQINIERDAVHRSLHGSVLRFVDPTGPVAEDDWDPSPRVAGWDEMVPIGKEIID